MTAEGTIIHRRYFHAGQAEGQSHPAVAYLLHSKLISRSTFGQGQFWMTQINSIGTEIAMEITVELLEFPDLIEPGLGQRYGIPSLERWSWPTFGGGKCSNTEGVMWCQASLWKYLLEKCMDATTKIDETSERVVDLCTTAIVALKSAVSSCALPVLRRLNVFSLFSA